MLIRVALFLLVCASVAYSQIPAIEPGVSEDLAKWRSTQYSNISYKLNLTLEKMSPVLRGSIEIHVTQAAYACAEPNCPPMAIILDWRKIPGHEKESTISNVTINGQPAGPYDPLGEESFYPDYREYSDHLEFSHRRAVHGDGVQMGENVIKLDFTSPILTSGSAITRYIDKEDGSEYIYSLFVPSDASTAFPVFDQPDLKARFGLFMSVPDGWSAVSNTPGKYLDETTFAGRNSVHWKGFDFEDTTPISTYVFAFAAGPWKEFTDAGTVGGNLSGSEGAGRDKGLQRTLPTGRVSASTADLSSHIYVRKSQAEKFKPHAAEVFRLNREAVKYLETYFDYKFPFPKYDLVLIPEFPFGGMEHAGATFLREDRVIFPAEPTANDYITRANVIFHEAAHQWFGDCVTMRWFDDLWLKEGFAEFMAYKTLEKVMPEGGNPSGSEGAPRTAGQFNAWKIFYERNKQAAYATDSTKGTTAIYQPIKNLSAAKSAYGNIVYRKAPSFLRQAEFYLGEDKFQTAVRAFLKKHEFANADWNDLVDEFANAEIQAVWNADFLKSPEYPKWKESEIEGMKNWAKNWVTHPGVSIVRYQPTGFHYRDMPTVSIDGFAISQKDANNNFRWRQRTQALSIDAAGRRRDRAVLISDGVERPTYEETLPNTVFYFPNYQDYGYGIFLLDDKSRDYVLKNIGREKDDFLRTMMWGSLWDSVREAELDPREYVELVIKNLGGTLQKPARSKGTGSKQSALETDETTIQSLLSRVSTALNYYVSEPPASVGGQSSTNWPAANAAGSDTLRASFEDLLLDRLQNASTAGQRITFFRAFVNNATTERSRNALKQMLADSVSSPRVRKGADKDPRAPSLTVGLRTKDRFDIVTRLAVLGDADAPKLLANLEKTETSDDAKRYAYVSHAAFAAAENKAKFFTDFLSNKNISESWIESAIVPFNSIRHADLTQQYLRRALAELPNLKRTRKIFFIGYWLAAFIGGQRDEKALAIINKFLADDPNLDNDLRLKILENSDLIERAIMIRATYKN